MELLYACSVCANPITSVDGQDLHCDRCGHVDKRSEPKSPRLALIFALTALVFYIPAMLLPFMTVELYGNRSSSTVWGGIISLAEAGSWGIAIVVFFASILIPAMKLIIMFYLCASAETGVHQRFKVSLYHFVEAIGRWSMLDIFLLAILVAILKLGHWTTVKAEMGSAMFLLVVVFTMLSSAQFDPRVLWLAKGKHT